ncbi:MAG: sensor histidine kinase, partial [Pseudomonadota bacterium]|nr:sensor histidine kinase [Pseudomonadota bacterium]
ARAEPGAAPAVVERIDLGELARRALADTHALAQARGTELVLDVDGAVFIDGERSALAALARNLVDNAVRYSPAGSKVEVDVRNEADAAVLQIDDAGPGIPAAERARVFDRFYRRAAGGEDGSGLGLAIVRSVAERHGATLTLDDSPAGGLRATMRFKPADAAGANTAAASDRGVRSTA